MAGEVGSIKLARAGSPCNRKTTANSLAIAPLRRVRYCGPMNGPNVREAFEMVASICDARRTAGRMLVALDFDGTLASIVPNPNEAALIDGAAPVLERLAERDDTVVAVITGRGIEDARR